MFHLQPWEVKAGSFRHSSPTNYEAHAQKKAHMQGGGSAQPDETDVECRTGILIARPWSMFLRYPRTIEGGMESVTWAPHGHTNEQHVFVVYYT